MPKLVWENFTTAVMDVGCSDTDLTVDVSAGQGALFPSPTGGDYAIAVFEDSVGNKEVVHVTTRVGDTLTVTRAREGTVAKTYPAGSRVELRVTKGFLEDFVDGGEYAPSGSSMNIRTMRSSTVNLEPLGLEEGELAVNVGDTPPVLYVGDGVSSLRVGPVVIDTTAPTNPKPGTIWADNTTGVRKIWLFSAWRELNSTTLHNPALNYAVGDTVVAEGALWSAPAPIAAGAFNNAEWTSEVGGAASSAFPAGTKMLFNQSSAPTGWTKDVVHNDKALRVVSGVAGDGGSVPFTSAFIGGNTGATALTVAQLPSHAHTMSGSTNSAGAHSHTIASGEIGEGGNLLNETQERNTVENNYSTSTAGSHSHSISASISSTGSGATHTHSLNLAVQYTDVIIATKDAE